MNKELFIQYAYALLILLITMLLAYLFRKTYNRFVNKNTLIVKNDPTNYKFVGYVGTAVIYIIGIGFAMNNITSFKALSNSILAGAGIIAAAIGFAAKEALSNLISGFFIIIFKPFRINDRIQVDSSNQQGIVEDITLRHTVIRNYENQRIIIPNATISNANIINSDHIDPRIKRWVEFDISYSNDLEQAKAILIKNVSAHPLFKDYRSKKDKANNVPAVPVKVVELGAYYIKIRAWVWAEEFDDAFVMKCDILESTLKDFNEAGIQIPFPTQNLNVKMDDNPNNS